MKLRPRTGAAYLEHTMLPLMQSINTPATSSSFLHCINRGHTLSQQSMLIQAGNKLEKFWNKVITDTDGIKNQLPFSHGTDRIIVENKNRQVDHFFTVDQDLNIYLEMKGNVNFDTEKKPASNNKILAVAKRLTELFGRTEKGYFMPCYAVIPSKIKTAYAKTGVNVYGVEDMFKWLGAAVPFTQDEYFEYLGTRIGDVWDEKCAQGTPKKVSQRQLHGNLDAL